MAVADKKNKTCALGSVQEGHFSLEKKPDSVVYIRGKIKQKTTCELYSHHFVLIWNTEGLNNTLNYNGSSHRYTEIPTDRQTEPYTISSHDYWSSFRVRKNYFNKKIPVIIINITASINIYLLPCISGCLSRLSRWRQLLHHHIGRLLLHSRHWRISKNRNVVWSIWVLQSNFSEHVDHWLTTGGNHANRPMAEGDRR